MHYCVTVSFEDGSGLRSLAAGVRRGVRCWGNAGTEHGPAWLQCFAWSFGSFGLCGHFEIGANATLWTLLFPVLTTNAIAGIPTASVLPETHVRTLRTTQGGLSHEDAFALVTAPSPGSSPAPGGPRMDPTQESFIDHMCAWRDAYLSAPEVCSRNLPLPYRLELRSTKNNTWDLHIVWISC